MGGGEGGENRQKRCEIIFEWLLITAREEVKTKLEANMRYNGMKVVKTQHNLKRDSNM